MKLTERLMAVAKLCRGSGVVIDVGCDHAKLPIYLVKNKIISRAVATDINEGPVRNAEKNIASAKLQQYITANQCNGLQGFTAESCDTVVVAGMGGQEIIEIIKNAPWLKGGHKLVLQPQSKEVELRCFLWQNGFCIRAEEVAVEGHHVYCILEAVYTGEGYLVQNYGLFSNEIFQSDKAVEYIRKMKARYTNQLNGVRVVNSSYNGVLVDIVSMLDRI